MASSQACRECEPDDQAVTEEADHQCSLCFEVLKDPVLTPCCNNRVCEACIKATKESANQCSLCENEPAGETVDKEIQPSERSVHCSQEEYGCSWVGRPSELAEHLGNNAKGCQYVFTSCSACEKKLCRYKLQEHTNNECQLRPYTCEFCDYASTFEDIVAQHYAKCPNFLISCPNQCTNEKFKRGSLDEHILNCPNEIVSCTFSEMGCKEKMKRSLLQQHIEDNVLCHQLMMCDAFKEMKKENEALKRDREELQEMKSAQTTADYWVNGCKIMAESVKQTHWREYLTSLAVLSTNIPEPVSPVIFKWSNYERMLKKAKEKGDTSPFYYFRPFYSHSGGCKMQLRIYPNGADHGKDTHISLYCHLMKGNNDNDLKWPFEGTVEVKMLNQVEDDKHYAQEIWELHSLPYDVIRQPDPYQIRNESGWGQAQFVSLSEVVSFSPHKQYLLNDTLYFQVTVKTNGKHA